MERRPIIQMSDDPAKKGASNEHEQAIAHFESHREMYEQYAGHSINVLPAPADLDTFAFDLNTNTIYLNDKFYQSLGYPEQGTSFATFHEIEHFREKIALLKEKGGLGIFQRYLDKLDPKKSEYSGAYGVMDNCISDVRQNSAVVGRTNEGFDAIEKSLYKDVQFPDVDFIKEGNKQPLHVQLPYAILNEYRSGRTCIVDPRVRKIIDELQHTTITKKDGSTMVVDVLDLMTNKDPKAVPMSKRLAIQDRYVWPKVLELLEEDLKEKAKQQKKEAEDGDGDKKESEESQGNQSKGGQDDKSGSNVKSPQEVQIPNKVFSDAYNEAKKRVPNAMPLDKQKEALKKWVEEKGDEEKRINKELAERLGVLASDLKKYKSLVQEVNRINPETNESAIDDLEHLIKKIISRRLKEKQSPKYPVEEGEELVDPAGWLAEVTRGNYEPKVWEDSEIKLQKDKKFGEVEITLVCDRSGSMKEDGGVKLREQQKALVLFMEALKRFNDILDEEEVSLEKPLSIKSEVFSFQADGNDSVPIKKMGKILTEKERIDSTAKVGSAPGQSTTDYVTLEAIHTGIDGETLGKIQEGELKKIVIVFTDGGSSDQSRVQNVLKTLRGKGVVVIGVGITESGTPAITTYAPESVLAKEAKDLPNVLAQILKEHLDGI